jgi:hypothetical protein
MRIALSVLTVGLLAGCAPAQLQNRFDASAVAWAAQRGTSNIRGEAFIRQRGGGVVTAAGRQVVLCPDSPIDREMNLIGARRQNFAMTPDARAHLSTCRMVRAGATGNFAFRDLPAGAYSVATAVTWSIPGSYIPEGGFIYENISVGEGETAEVVLTR